MHFDTFFLSLRAAHTVSVEEEQHITNVLSLRHVKEGTVLQPAGNTARELYYITGGILRLVKHTSDGKDITLFFLKSGKFATVMDSFQKQEPAEYSLEAACDSSVIVLKRSLLIGLYPKIPYLEPFICHLLQQGLLEKINTRNEYMGLDATERYARFLLKEPDLVRQVPLQAIASFLGITQQSLSRIRKSI